MKYRNLRHWLNPEKVEGLVFLAQLLEELLFDYSLDTYKPSAMNSSTLCLEALHIIDTIEDNVAPEHSIKHVLDELSTNLSKDIVAKSLVPLRITEITDKLTNKNTPISVKRTLLEILASHLSLPKYKEENEKQLADIIRDGSKKEAIRNLARSYITTLINIGYSTSYLYPTSRQFFYMGKSSISSPDDIFKYFAKFPFKDQTYKALIVASDIFLEIEDSCEVFDITLTKDAPLQNTGGKSATFPALDSGEVYLMIADIQSKDVHTARSVAEKRVEMVSTLMSLFHHKDIAKWRDSVLLINEETGKVRGITSPTNPILKCMDYRTKHAAEKLNHLIKHFSLAEQKSFIKFFRSAELHRLSLKNTNAETQLLNLWVALETLVPEKPYTQKPRVNTIIDATIPFLSSLYIPRLIRALRKDLFEWDSRAIITALEGIAGASNDEKVFLLLTDKKNSQAKDKLISDFKNFYLLRNRFYYLSEQLSCPRKASKLLRIHWERVDWQIRRIYRTRNYIVHSGYAPPFVDILLTNLHDYLDQTLNAVIEMASCENKIENISQAFEYANLVATEQLNYFGLSRDSNWDDGSRKLLLNPLPNEIRPTNHSNGRA